MPGASSSTPAIGERANYYETCCSSLQEHTRSASARRQSMPDQPTGSIIMNTAVEPVSESSCLSTSPLRHCPVRVSENGVCRKPARLRPGTTSARFCILIQGVDNLEQAPLRPAPIPQNQPLYSRS